MDRLDGEPMLGEKQRVPTDPAAEIECRAGAARLQPRQQCDDVGLGIKPVGTALGSGSRQGVPRSGERYQADLAQLRHVIDQLDSGDVLLVTRLDRLAQSTRDY